MTASVGSLRCRSDHFRALWPVTAFDTLCLSLLNEKLSFVFQKRTVWAQREVAQVSRVGMVARSFGGLHMAGLAGNKDVCACVERSEPIVRKWIKTEGLPATKIGGAWISDTELIDEWRAKRIVEQCRRANAERWQILWVDGIFRPYRR